MPKLSKEDKDEVRRLYSEWEQACADEDDAISRKSLIESELDDYDIDPVEPPKWLTS